MQSFLIRLPVRTASSSIFHRSFTDKCTIRKSEANVRHIVFIEMYVHLSTNLGVT